MVGPSETVLDVKRKVAANASVAQLLRTRRKSYEDMKLLRAGGDTLDNDEVLQRCLLTDGKSQLLWPMPEQSDLTRVHPGTFASPSYSQTFPDRCAPWSSGQMQVLIKSQQASTLDRHPSTFMIFCLKCKQ